MHVPHWTHRAQDEEDAAWLGILNREREPNAVQPVSEITFERVMNAFERESYLEAEEVRAVTLLFPRTFTS